MLLPVRKNQGWLPDVFNDFFDTDWMERANATAPAINVIESDKDYKVELAAPGMKKEDFAVRINEENELVVSMEHKEDKEEDPKENKKTRRYLRREFSYSKFQQNLILPDDVDKNKIEAKVENGILTVTLPKLTLEDKEKNSKVISIA
jgi:HSP20 family protein